MTRRIVLIGNPPDDAWASVAQAALGSTGNLDLINEDRVVQGGWPPGSDLAIVDAVTVAQPEVLVDWLHRAHPDLPIVVVTASPTWRRARAAFLAGATDYLHKTLDADELRPALREALSGNEPSVAGNGE